MRDIASKLASALCKVWRIKVSSQERAQAVDVIMIALVEASSLDKSEVAEQIPVQRLKDMDKLLSQGGLQYYEFSVFWSKKHDIPWVNLDTELIGKINLTEIRNSLIAKGFGLTFINTKIK